MTIQRAAVFALPVLIVALFVMAVCAPRWMHQDEAASLSDLERRQLKNHVGRPELPSLVSEITEGEKRSNAPADVIGRVSYRTLFGVPVGEGEWDGQDITVSYSYGLIMLVGLVFLAAEAALFGL